MKKGPVEGKFKGILDGGNEFAGGAEDDQDDEDDESPEDFPATERPVKLERKKASFL